MALITEELKPYIIKRIDGDDIGDSIPKRKDLKIIIKCSRCGFERQSNSLDVLNKGTLCKSCIQIEKVENGEYDYSYRKTKEYREGMSKSIKNSDKYKKSRWKINLAIKKYWERVRGGKLEDVYDDWYIYRKTVYRLTEQTYKKFHKVINPNNVKRGRGKYHLDHMFSILEGFKNNIPPYILSHKANLQMLLESDNISKDFRCDITMEELFKGVLGSERKVYGS